MKSMHKINFFNCSPAPLDFARPPTGVYAGGIGGMFGSPVFGPPLVGPFNNPVLREERIMELFDHNRIRNNRPKFEERFSLGDIDMGFDMSEPLPGLRRDRHERPDRNGRRRSRGQF